MNAYSPGPPAPSSPYSAPAPTPKKQPSSKAPLFLGIGCGALALSCVGCIAIGMIFGPSPEELEARRARETPEIEAYYGQVAATFPHIPQPSGTVTRCPTLVRDPTTRRGTLELPTLLYEGLADWARQPAQGTGTSWQWLNSIERKNLADESPTAVHSIHGEVAELKRVRYLAVVRASQAIAPMAGADETYTMGTFSGSLFIVDTQTASVVCEAPFTAVSSSSVETGGGVRIGRIGPTVGDTDLQDAVTEDMQEQTVRALRSALGQMSDEIALDTRPAVRL